MRILITYLLFYMGIILPQIGVSQDVGAAYIAEWKQFYPSKAVAQGMHSSIYQLENRSLKDIDNWIDYNQDLEQTLSQHDHPYRLNQAIDTRLLLAQIKGELNTWQHKQIHHHSLRLYSKLINDAIQDVLKSDFLLQPEKIDLLCTRFSDIQALCTAAQENVTKVDQHNLDRAITQLEETSTFLKTQLIPNLESESPISLCKDSIVKADKTISQINQLISFAENKLRPTSTTSNPILGKKEYARRLAWYTDSDLTPDELERMALKEIETVRALILESSRDYIHTTYPDTQATNSSDDIIRLAFDDMEKDAPTDAVDYKLFWEDLAAKAIEFIRMHNIATLPKVQTLRIESAPESAGPAARIGWVDSAAPFAPNPVTTLFLPSIPDTLSAQEQKDFWSSFNKPFNRMIVIHELFPGHYMQIKQSRETAHPVRLLFPHPVYFEGWATFTERVCLDEGWDADKPLTYLAHLRKRLENANRAYTSIQVHCHAWDQQQVMQFSTESSLVAPQFAKSLWGRIMRSPMQLTTYFYGGKQFSELLAAEKERLGETLNLQLFMDTIMKAGPIPIDEFIGIFRHTH